MDDEGERLGWDVVSGPEEFDADGLTGLVNIDHHTIAEVNGPGHRLGAHLEVASLGSGVVLHVHTPTLLVVLVTSGRRDHEMRVVLGHDDLETPPSGGGAEHNQPGVGMLR